MRVESWLGRAAAARPSALAVQTPTGSLTYRELALGAGAVAALLGERGVRGGERVAIDLPAGLDFAAALHGTLLAGAVAVPVDERLGAAERETVLAGAVAVLGAEELSALPEASRRAPAAPGAGAPPAAVPGAAAPVTHDLSSPAILIHTSGTSARPKPVVLSYGNLLWSALGSAVAIGAEPDDRWLCAMPLAHVGGLSILLRSAIRGSTAVVHERFETARVLRSLSDERITVVSLVATTLARLLDAGLREPPELRCALVGGGPVPDALLERAWAAGVPACQTYGLSEACSQVASASPFDVAEQGPETDGAGGAGARRPRGARPLFCTSVRIGADGEILVAGPTVAAESIAEDGWLHTGDLGSLQAVGTLRVHGRASETIVTGGENVSPVEVEQALAEHPDVVEAAVVGRPDGEWGEAVTAIVVARAGSATGSAELLAHCAARLAPYKVPKVIELVGGPLPRTGSGKLLRRALS
ncbi:MAG: AMP-binding protein [Acidobacteriota bacterium]|nr:AMP-binding protein [Acidobacteriota bacterium]